MEVAEKTTIRLSGEQAKHLTKIAGLQGVTEEELVADALESLFRRNPLPEEENLDDMELLRLLEAELGPSKARAVPPLSPANFIVTHAVPIRSDLIRRPGDKQ